jgi:hypothetical protein
VPTTATAVVSPTQLKQHTSDSAGASDGKRTPRFVIARLTFIRAPPVRVSPRVYGSALTEGLPCEVVDGQTGVTHDLPKKAHAKITAAMHRHCRVTAVGMFQNQVTSALAHRDKAVLPQD